LSSIDATSRFAESIRKGTEGQPVFPEPWNAEVFALTVQLHRNDLFSWSQWAEALSFELNKSGRCQLGSDYFDCWCDALCNLLVDRGILDTAQIAQMQASWKRAAEATPHGKPILLENDPHR
jgi:nitrile hydratase accessory protein